MGWIIVVILLWVAFNLAASYTPILTADRISPGRLPAELLKRGEARRVRFYVGNTVSSYAFSSWAPPFHIVVFNRHFFARATPELIRFVIAHELGHAAAKHHIWRWLAVVSLAIVLPQVRRALRAQEDSADAYATQLTGFKKEFFEKFFKPQPMKA